MKRLSDDSDAPLGALGEAAAPMARLAPIESFGSNPGNLRMYLHAPPPRRTGARPLVVVLHGCRQTAADFDLGAGWTALADAHDFIVLYPEQRRANNARGCFNWFEPGDVARDEGEAGSIGAMIRWVVENHPVDSGAVFVCGLSAGGAMSAALLAAYSDLFAGGAIIAGLPVGAAATIDEAVDSMYVGRVRKPREWGDRVRAVMGDNTAGHIPAVSIWHGLADATVKPLNGGELVKQWTDVHGLSAATPTEDSVGPAARRRWHDASGRACVLEYVIPVLGHGVPVEADAPPLPFFLPVGLSATRRIAADFGLLGDPSA